MSFRSPIDLQMCFSLADLWAGVSLANTTRFVGDLIANNEMQLFLI